MAIPGTLASTRWSTCRIYSTYPCVSLGRAASSSKPTLSSSRRRSSTSSSSSPIPSTEPPAQSQSQSTKDPSHPYLHYHTFSHPSPGRIALSFLPYPPIQNSRTILGYLPLDGRGGLSDFKENNGFRDILHESIKDGLKLGRGEAADFEAQGRGGDGYIHITDERAIPPAGRIGETEDLIGSVFVENAKIIADTYEPQPSYRLVTSNGPLVLPKGLDEQLIETLEAIDKQEKGQ